MRGGRRVASGLVRNQTIESLTGLNHAQLIARTLFDRFLTAVQIVDLGEQLIVTRFQFSIAALLERNILIDPHVIVNTIFAQPQ
ncbi:hypothetical protein D3C72_2269280 [compost metagenome]